MYNEDMNNRICNGCGDCGYNKCCANPKPVFEVLELPDDPLTLSFNFNGLGTTYDFSNMIKKGETDTVLSADAVKRVLEYMAERHTDTISAKELGAILHLTDIGDVDVAGVDANSMLVYNKESDCTRGCDGATNKWVAHNALDHIVSSLQYVMGYDANGAPKTLGTPTNPAQQYLLAWNGNDKAGWMQIKTVATRPTNAYQVYWDEDQHQLVKVKVV